MTIKHRIQKLENKLGINRMYVLEVGYGVDSTLAKSQFCSENGINQDEENLFIFIRKFTPAELGSTAQNWKLLS